MEKLSYPSHSVRSIICGPSSSGKSVFLTRLVLNFIKEYDIISIYSPSLLQDLYQKLIKCFSNYIPFHIIPNILNEEDFDIVIEEMVNNEDFEKSDTEMETFESIEELKFLKDYHDGGIVILDDFNEKKRMIF